LRVAWLHEVRETEHGREMPRSRGCPFRFKLEVIILTSVTWRLLLPI
jgi:hypothetical protein